MSLLHPPPGFPAHLALVWPLIWVQVLVLRATIRAAYGKGTQYRWSVTPCGRVFLVSINWIPSQKSERAWLKPAAHPNARIAAALDGSAFTPGYIRLRPLLPREKGLGKRGQGIAARAAFAGTQQPLTPTPLPGERGLPRPDT